MLNTSDKGPSRAHVPWIPWTEMAIQTAAVLAVLSIRVKLFLPWFQNGSCQRPSEDQTKLNSSAIEGDLPLRISVTVTTSQWGRSYPLPCFAGWWFEPLWKILVIWDDYSQYMGNIKKWQPNHQPVLGTMLFPFLASTHGSKKSKKSMPCVIHALLQDHTTWSPVNAWSNWSTSKVKLSALTHFNIKRNPTLNDLEHFMVMFIWNLAAKSLIGGKPNAIKHDEAPRCSKFG